MQTSEIREVNIGITRQRAEKLVTELQEGLAAKPDGVFNIQFYDGKHNASQEEVVLTFSNDDMEADVNPDVDPNVLLYDFED